MKSLQKYTTSAALGGCVAMCMVACLLALPVYASEVTGTLTPDLGEGGNGGTVIVNPTILPVSATYTSARTVTITAAGSSRIYYTTTGATPSCGSGASYSGFVGTQYVGSFSVPSTATVKAKACYLDSDDTMHVSSVSSVTYTITIPESTPTPPSNHSSGGSGVIHVTTPNTSPTGASGSYSPGGAMNDALTINIDKSLLVVTGTNHCTPGTLIKLPNDHNPRTQEDSTVYYCGNDGKRYDFPNLGTYKTWYDDFSDVTVISAADMAAIPLGGNVTYRPGIHMVKSPTNPTVYVVVRGGILRPIASEAVAIALYGSKWNTMIDDISDAFFVNYRIGSPVGLADIIVN